MFSFNIILDLKKISFDGDIFIGIPSSDDTLSPVETRLCFLYIRSLDKNSKVYILPLIHSEFTECLDINLVKDFIKNLKVKKFVVNKKNFLHFIEDNDVIDINYFYFSAEDKIINEEEFDTNAQKFIKNRCYKLRNINVSVPLLKLIEKYNSIFHKFVDDIYKFYNPDNFNENVNNELIYNLYKIEKNGLKIDNSIFLDKFGDNFRKHITDKECVYSNYNIYTSTGRPSNSFGGINYSALNKNNMERKFFISRYGEEGSLVNFDYSAFHPRLITTLIDYEIPYDVNIYDYLGKFYFNKEKLTKEEHEESKKLTFHLLYGGIKKEYLGIEYFKRIDSFSDNLWGQFNSNKYIETLIFGRKIKAKHIENPFPSKIFNYFLQSYEMEIGCKIITELNKFLEDKKTKLILYQYDGFLIDFYKPEGNELLVSIKNILMMDNKFPLRIKSGKNFKNLVDINL